MLANEGLAMLKSMVQKLVVSAQLHLLRDREDQSISSTELYLQMDEAVSPLGSRWVYMRIQSDGQTPQILTAPPDRTGESKSSLITWEIVEIEDDSIIAHRVASVGLIEFENDRRSTGVAIEFSSGRTLFIVPNVDGMTSVVNALEEAGFPASVVLSAI